MVAGQTDPIGAKMVGTEDQQRQLAVKRKIRDIVGAHHARDHAEIIPRDGAAFWEPERAALPALFRVYSARMRTPRSLTILT